MLCEKKKWLLLAVISLLLLFVLAFNKELVSSQEDGNEDEVEAAEPIIPKIATVNALLPEENSKMRTKPTTHLVLHFTSNVAEKPMDPYRLEDIRQIFIDSGVSAHYMIGREGEIYSLVPEDRVAYHAGKGELSDYPHYKDQLNDYSIGIELMAIGTKEEMGLMMDETDYEAISPEYIGYTDAQYESLKKLIQNITARNPGIKKDRSHIIGHDEYAPERKTDPGSLLDWTRLGF